MPAAAIGGVLLFLVAVAALPGLLNRSRPPRRPAVCHLANRDGVSDTRPLPEFREMFFEIWAARPRTKLLKIWAQRGLDRRSDPQFRAIERVRCPSKTDHSDRRRRERGEIAPEDQNTVFPT